MTEFEELVVERLEGIEQRLSSIEERFEEATSFASDIMGEKDGVLESFDLGGLVSSLLGSGAQIEPSNEGSAAHSLSELSGVLQGFRDRLEVAKQAILDVSEDSAPTKEGLQKT
jgi:hypothetical protein